jgi:hypothetical protein
VCLEEKRYSRDLKGRVTRRRRHGEAPERRNASPRAPRREGPAHPTSGRVEVVKAAAPGQRGTVRLRVELDSDTHVEGRTDLIVCD